MKEYKAELVKANPEKVDPEIGQADRIRSDCRKPSVTNRDRIPKKLNALVQKRL